MLPERRLEPARRQRQQHRLLKFAEHVERAPVRRAVLARAGDLVDPLVGAQEEPRNSELAGQELLSVFTSSAAGDPHALDPGSPLVALVLRAAAELTGRAELPATAHERRRIWREVGIDCDSLSADVLVLGVRPVGDGRLSRQLRESAADGEPRRLTLRELGRAGLDERARSGGCDLPSLALPAGEPVHICEYPAVVEAAADAGGARCAALVCVEGVPSTAAMVLLRAFARAGARVRAQADFDWAGLRIAGQVIAETGGEP